MRFKVQGLGFRVCGSGFGVWGLGFMGFRVETLELRRAGASPTHPRGPLASINRDVGMSMRPSLVAEISGVHPVGDRSST